MLANCGVPQSVFLRRDMGAKPHVSLRGGCMKLQQWGVQTAHLIIAHGRIHGFQAIGEMDCSQVE